MTRENGAPWSRRCAPLSKIVRLPFERGRRSCCCASGGLPSFHRIRPLGRSMIATVEMFRKLATRLPSGISATALPCALFAAVLGGNDLCRDVEVLPASPFPDNVAARGHLEEIVGVHCAVDLRSGQAALDAPGQLARDRTQTQQQDVAVVQLPRVVMVIGMSDLPDD